MARKENTFIGVFNNQEEVLNKVTELKAKGHNESDMYVVGRDNKSFSTVQTQTDVHLETTEKEKNQGFMGKFMTALSGEPASLAAFKGMGLERYEEKEYAQQVQNGKLVLYVDSGYGDTYDEYNTGYSTDYSNSSGITQNEPLETGASFAKSSTSGSAADQDSNRDASSSHANNPFALKDSNSELTSGSSADADSDFGKSIPKDGSRLEPTPDTAGASFSSNSTSSTSGTTESTSDTSGRSFDSTADTGSTFSSTGGNARSTSDTFGDAMGSTTSGITDEERLLLHEERLSVDKERVQTGEVNVSKHVVEENQSIDVPVEREEVYVERHQVNEEADSTEAFQDNDSIHVPLTEERVNVSKKEIVTEEIVISKRKVQDTERVNETVRREVADIDENTNNANNNTKKTNNNNRK